MPAYYIKPLLQEMQEQNREVVFFELRTGIGLSIYDGEKIKNLDSLIEQADKKMYEEKRRKHR